VPRRRRSPSSANASSPSSAETADAVRDGDTARSGYEIAQNVALVATAAQNTSRGVSETGQATHDLARMSSELNVLVGTFRS
jgi:methyl-accepting chemotaxis protein